MKLRKILIDFFIFEFYIDIILHSIIIKILIQQYNTIYILYSILNANLFNQVSDKSFLNHLQTGDLSFPNN